MPRKTHSASHGGRADDPVGEAAVGKSGPGSIFGDVRVHQYDTVLGTVLPRPPSDVNALFHRLSSKKAR